MKKATIIFAALVLTVLNTYGQKVWNLDKGHAKLGFTVTHLAVSEVDGLFTSFDAKITTSKEDFSDAVFELTADAKTVTTNNSGRDGHLQKEDMFSTEKFPTLTFKSTSISKVSEKKYKLNGDLTIKGVTKPVSLDLVLIGTTVNQRNQKKIAGFKASGSFKRTDFGVGGMPSLVVSEDVELRATGEFIQN